MHFVFHIKYWWPSNLIISTRPCLVMHMPLYICILIEFYANLINCLGGRGFNGKQFVQHNKPITDQGKKNMKINVQSSKPQFSRRSKMLSGKDGVRAAWY